MRKCLDANTFGAIMHWLRITASAPEIII